MLTAYRSPDRRSPLTAKALHLHRGQDAWGHLVARLLQELPDEAPGELVAPGLPKPRFDTPARFASACRLFRPQ